MDLLCEMRRALRSVGRSFSDETRASHERELSQKKKATPTANEACGLRERESVCVFHAFNVL
jgi:hypothetical protein